MGHFDAFFNGHVFDGDEWADVGGADAGMFADVMIEVDQFGGFGDGAEGGFFDVGGWANVGNNGAIVVGVGTDVEDAHGVDGADGVGDGVVDVGVTAVAKIGNTFN